MALIYGQLESAQLENRTSDYSATASGRIWFRTDTTRPRLADGTLVKDFLLNDGHIIIGTNATANNNVRLHRGANSVLQFVLGGDATAEGTLSTAIAQVGFRLANYATVGLPAFGNAGRTVWNTDTTSIQVDTGAAWIDASVGTNTVLNTNLRQSAGLSLIGRSANTTGNVADITAVTDGHVLRLSGTTLGFGQIVTAGITDANITTAKIADGAVTFAKLDSTTVKPLMLGAAVNFNAVQISGTYTRAGTSVTITLAGHGFLNTTGQKVLLDYTTGSATDGYYTVFYTSSSVFTVNDPGSGVTSGAVTLKLRILSSVNLASMSYDAVGQYTLTFSSAFSSINYYMSGAVQTDTSASQNGGSVLFLPQATDPRTTTTLKIQTVRGDAGPNTDDFPLNSVLIMGF